MNISCLLSSWVFPQFRGFQESRNPMQVGFAALETIMKPLWFRTAWYISVQLHINEMSKSFLSHCVLWLHGMSTFTWSDPILQKSSMKKFIFFCSVSQCACICVCIPGNGWTQTLVPWPSHFQTVQVISQEPLQLYSVSWIFCLPKLVCWSIVCLVLCVHYW